MVSWKNLQDCINDSMSILLWRFCSIGAYSARRAGRMTCTRPTALTCFNPRAHWPKVSVA